jgi:hypothetical protein
MLMMLAASGALAQKVHVEFDESVDFCRFKTYAWLESKHPADGLWAQRVMTAIDRQLIRKGLQKVDGSTSPDLEIVYNSDIKERTISAGCDYGCVLAEYLFNQAYGPPRFWPEPGSWVSEVEKNGSLVVGLVDASRKDMVWRGMAKDTLSDKTEKNERKLNKAIEKMFKKYPPKRRCRWGLI